MNLPFPTELSLKRVLGGFNLSTVALYRRSTVPARPTLSQAIPGNSLPPGGKSFLSLDLQASNLATPSESPTTRSCTFRQRLGSMTAELAAAVPLAHLRYPRSQPLRIHPVAAAAATASPPPALLKRLTPDQDASFLRVWAPFPSRLLVLTSALRENKRLRRWW